MTSVHILSDNPAQMADDLLNFDRYIDTLVTIITNPATNTPLNIGIFGSWGSGKSTLLNMLDEKLNNKYKGSFLCIHFDAWVHRNEENMLIALLHTFHDQLLTDETNRFKSSAEKISSILLRLGTDIFLKKVTANVVDVEKLENLEKSFFNKRGTIISEMRQLRTSLLNEVEVMAKKGIKVVFFIDDLDRCEPDQIIDLLESVKLFLDLKHVFVILAVDKGIIDKGIQIKYHEFAFATDRAESIGAEYLEKMIQLPLQLFPLHPNQVSEFLLKLDPPAPVVDEINFLKKVLFANPRKIKRVVNILTLVTDIINRTPALKNLNHKIVTSLVVLQVQSASLFSNIIKTPELLFALEWVYKDKIPANDVENFNKYEEKREIIQSLCKKYYQPESYLKILFDETDFASVKNNIGDYLSMVGG